MATYAIGDIHGCYDQLQDLLNKINFDPLRDTLWCTGDLINGGPQPVETLEFLKSLEDRCICVLGNHDLVLLGVAAGKLTAPIDRKIGFNPVLNAINRDDLLNWLRMRPLIHYDAKFNALIVHAGILPSWDLHKAQSLAHEVQSMLRSFKVDDFYSNMFGNTPDTWDDQLQGWDRLRFIVNCFTRMRFCNSSDKLELHSKGGIDNKPEGYDPWFLIAQRKITNTKIIFGHWAGLMGITGVDNALAIDTGCVWGRNLTAVRLDDWQRFSVRGLLD